MGTRNWDSTSSSKSSSGFGVASLQKSNTFLSHPRASRTELQHRQRQFHNASFVLLSPKNDAGIDGFEPPPQQHLIPDAKIKLQKERAIALWGRICEESKEAELKTTEATSKNKKQETAANLEKSIMCDLEQGLVPPIFHALVMGEKGLFPRNSETHLLSAKPVDAGTALKENAVKELSMSGDNSDVFFSSFNSGGVCQANAKFWDMALKATWEFSKEETKNVVALVNAKATMVGEDIEETKLRQSTFGMLPEEDRALLTRRLSRGVVSNCFGASKLSSSLAIVGSPGTGKSWTLLYALQQALLYDGACVMLFQQKGNNVTLCLRKDHLIYVWTTHGGESYADSILFDRKEVLVLLDPVEGKIGGAKYAQNKRMLIFAASNNENHFRNGILKANAGALRYLSPWSEEELTVGLPRMKQDIDLELALTRAEVVGMLPRYLLDEKAFEERNKMLDYAVSDLSENPKLMEGVVRFRGMVTQSHTIPGTIFAVFSDVQEPADDVQDGSLPESIYDGQFGVVYTERTLGIMSNKVVTEVIKNSRDIILSFWNVVNSSKQSSMGQVVEELFWSNLSSPDKDGREMKQWKLIKGEEALQEQNFILTTPLKHLSDQRIENVKSILESEGTVARMEVNCPLIGFAGPGHKVYQVTLSGDPIFNLTIMKDLLFQLGYLKQDGDKLCQVDVNAAPQDQLDFYWVVPYGRERVWKTKRPKTVVVGGDKQKEVLRDCIKDHVIQHVLIMGKQEK
jgi:hypothetical protein